jgi:hypothetical protein
MKNKILIIILIALLISTGVLLINRVEKEKNDSQRMSIVREVVLDKPKEKKEEVENVEIEPELYEEEEEYAGMSEDEINIVKGFKKDNDMRIRDIFDEFEVNLEGIESIEIPEMYVNKFMKNFLTENISRDDVLELGFPVVVGNEVPEDIYPYIDLKKKYENEGFFILQDDVYRMILSKNYDLYPTGGPTGEGYKLFSTTYRWNVNLYPKFDQYPIVNTNLIGTLALYVKEGQDTSLFAHNVIKPINYEYNNYSKIKMNILKQNDILDLIEKGETYILQQKSSYETDENLFMYRLSGLNDSLLPEPTIKYIDFKFAYKLVMNEEKKVSYLVPSLMLGGFIQFDELENVDDYYVETYIPILSVYKDMISKHSL